MILSSDTEQITQGSLGFQEKSGILAVWPPWINSNSGGPSSASSGDCSSPILLKSQTFSLRSVPLEAKIVSLWGDHWTCMWEKNLSIRKLRRGEFPGGPLLKNPPYNVGDKCLIPDQGTKIPHTAGQQKPTSHTSRSLCNATKDPCNDDLTQPKQVNAKCHPTLT